MLKIRGGPPCPRSIASPLETKPRRPQRREPERIYVMRCLLGETAPQCDDAYAPVPQSAASHRAARSSARLPAPCSGAPQRRDWFFKLIDYAAGGLSDLRAKQIAGSRSPLESWFARS